MKKELGIVQKYKSDIISYNDSNKKIQNIKKTLKTRKRGKKNLIEKMFCFKLET